MPSQARRNANGSGVILIFGPIDPRQDLSEPAGNRPRSRPRPVTPRYWKNDVGDNRNTSSPDKYPWGGHRLRRDPYFRSCLCSSDLRQALACAWPASCTPTARRLGRLVASDGSRGTWRPAAALADASRSIRGTDARHGQRAFEQPAPTATSHSMAAPQPGRVSPSPQPAFPAGASSRETAKVFARPQQSAL
jgi:hypothetical protein